MTRCEEQPPLASTPHHLEGTPEHREAQHAAGAHQHLLMLRMRGTGTGDAWKSTGCLGISCGGLFYLLYGLLQPLSVWPGHRAAGRPWEQNTSLCASMGHRHLGLSLQDLQCECVLGARGRVSRCACVRGWEQLGVHGLTLDLSEDPLRELPEGFTAPSPGPGPRVGLEECLAGLWFPAAPRNPAHHRWGDCVGCLEARQV